MTTAAIRTIITAVEALIGEPEGPAPGRYVRLHSTMVAAWEAQQAVRQSSDESKEAAKSVLDDRVNDFFNILMGEFNAPISNEVHSEIKELFSGVHPLFYGGDVHDGHFLISPDNTKLMTKYEDAVVAVACARLLLSFYRVTFNPPKIIQWDAFSDRYQDLILQ